MDTTFKIAITIVKNHLVFDSIHTAGMKWNIVGVMANAIGLDGKSGYDIALENGYRGSEEQYGLYPIVQGDYAKNAALYATAQGERTKEIGDHPPQIIDGYWWLFNYDTREYESSEIVANGMYPTFDIDTQTMELTMSVAEGFTGGNFAIDSNGQLNFII